ncbi:hypothetical protein SAMN06265379_10525 [Saccharicrinis carchari]|uniref:Uncharacterized protein n=1 Tax=Saccharicrinis carchari TaxID=1168039 RepID=A0A521DBQ3_SACCC|nr:hypothetical protein SAMN06265379_10525 [Saccharicrinis carchari]
MREHFRLKHPYLDPKDVIFGLFSIDIAANSYMPKMLQDLSWEQVKENIKSHFRNYFDQEAGL